MSVPANCRQNNSGTVHRLLIFDPRVQEKNHMFSSDFLRATACDSVVRYPAGEYPFNMGSEFVRMPGIGSFYEDTGIFQRMMDVETPRTLQGKYEIKCGQ